MMKIWANFAATGNPSSQGLVAWPAYNSTDEPYLYIDKTLEVKTGFSKTIQK
jgi:carboxylesterase type B